MTLTPPTTDRCETCLCGVATAHVGGRDYCERCLDEFKIREAVEEMNDDE